MSELTVFINVFFRNEDGIVDFYESVRSKIGPHRAVFLVNNVSPTFQVKKLSSLGTLTFVDEILQSSTLRGVEQFLRSGNARYVKHFFAGVAYCETEFFTFFDPDNICLDYDWIAEAQARLKRDHAIVAICPYWGKIDTPSRAFVDSGFSDQLFVGRSFKFKEFDYAINSTYSWMYPLRQNGPTFESAVFSNMLMDKLRRAVLCEYSYSHANEGQGYAKRELMVGAKRFLARAAWYTRTFLLRDRRYE